MTPDDDAIEAARALHLDEYVTLGAALDALGAVLAALDERDRELAETRAEAQRERERAEAAERDVERWRKRHSSATAGYIVEKDRADTARREAIEEAIGVAAHFGLALSGVLHSALGIPAERRCTACLGTGSRRNASGGWEPCEGCDATGNVTREAPSTDEGTAGG